MKEEIKTCFGYFDAGFLYGDLVLFLAQFFGIGIAFLYNVTEYMLDCPYLELSFQDDCTEPVCVCTCSSLISHLPLRLAV